MILKPLCELKRDQKGRVASMSLVAEDLQRLASAGLVPQSQIKVISNSFHDVLLSAGQRVQALDHEVASAVLVEVI